MAEAVVKSKFGQREPPLTNQIVSILNRYPDGGQILKELIQNADDAEAKEVKFLYDGRQFGVNNLTSKHLKDFQGPALYAFNDAKFKESDWDGIQNLMKSNKKEDILKVGRFGIGFNSVYHITDLPGIASGKKIGFLDPHKRCFEEGEPGVQYEVDSKLLRQEHLLRDQFEPFKGVFGFDFHEEYPHTLFRFPLRKYPSELSQTEYTKEKVEKLFNSLREEAPIILLFMKHIQHISVYERLDENDTVKCLFEVEIARETREIVQQERQKMFEKAKQALSLTVTESSCVVDISLSSMNGTGHTDECFRWLVINQIGLAEKDEKVEELSKTLSLLPWIGCAVPLNENAQKEDSGRIFCSLPLPHDVDCKTGLPVLVHGAFGVTDNRRGLLWPGNECQNNETAEWNVLLVKKILSSVFRKVLKAIITDHPATGLHDVERRDLVYNTLPKLSNVIGHWKDVLDPLFHELKHLNLFFTQSRGPSSWVTLQEGLLDQMIKDGVSDEMRGIVLKTLLQNHSIITELPEHVSEIVEKYFGAEKQDITPEILRNLLLKPNSMQTASREDKLRLLEYVLHDNPQPQMLTGIPLLPLSSGEFKNFTHHSNPSQLVFVPSDNCSEDLLPNMQNHFLDMNIPAETRRKLVEMAALDEPTATQMVLLSPDLVVSCLRRCLPEEWFNPNQNSVSWKHDHPKHPSKKWITDIWHWINEIFEESLEKFEGIPLIPFEIESEAKLGVLSKTSKFIFSSDSSQNMQLPQQIVKILQASGCVVLPCQPTFPHVRHPDICSYIASPVPTEVIQKLHSSSWNSAKEFIMNCPRNEWKTIQNFFASAQMSEDLRESYVNALRDLPLLETLGGKYTTAVVDGENLWVASPDFKLPDGFDFRKADCIISSAESESAQLVGLLKLVPCKPVDIFCHFLFPDIETQSIYNREETTKVMLWLLERVCDFKDDLFHDKIKNLSFVSTLNGELRKPSQIYNPDDPLLRNLFIGDGSKFPSTEFCEPRVIGTLTDYGLRTPAMIESSDLLGAVEMLASLKYEDSLSKVKALIEVLQQHPKFLQQHPKFLQGIDVATKLAGIAWLPRAKKHKKGFPSFMDKEWYNTDIMFYKSDEIFRESCMLLVGTSAPILGVDIKKSLQDALHINEEVNLDQVIKHLKTCVRVWDEKKKSTYIEMQYIEMLKEIYVYLSKRSSREEVSRTILKNGLEKWIWHGAGFCAPKQLALEKDLPFEFRPPLFLLPEALNDGKSLTDFFRDQGVCEQFSKEDIISVLVAIKKTYEETVRPISPKEQEKDLKFCRSVLEWLVSDGQKLDEDLRRKIFVPVQKDDKKLVLEECEKCTYCDQEWLKHGKSELDIPDDIQLIHDSITTKTAILLGVPSLSSCLLSAECVEFEQTGPYEPITTRIKNILKEYKEGVGIFKELIQNADDAGADTVKFLVDWRTGKTGSLFSPDMAPSQGPALWAYNNAVFTDKDFENINKLAGGTKVEDLSKIGRFGLGFNAVYHLTDVPSFISRSILCIFDPNVNHISNHIRDKSRPGIRIDLAKNPRPLTAFADQFSLYNEIFECKTALNDKEKFSYQGTLFRFPFRTTTEAEKSEMCQTVYNQVEVKRIVDTLLRNASLILLFTQNVKRVELYELAAEDCPQNMKLILSINKEVLSTNKEISTIPEVVQVSPYIKRCSNWWNEKKSLSEAPWCLEQVEIRIDKEDTANETGARDVKTSPWLVSYCVGKNLSIKLAREEGEKDGLLPLAGAAALLQSNSNDDAMIAKQVNGEAFCFLPLSISTGLPVHVNSSFAVRSNRDGIWEKTTAEENLESRWNDTLLQDAIPEAYFQLLHGMVNLSKNNSLTQFDQRFHDFWPRLATSRTSWTVLVSSFYTKLLAQNLKLFCSTGKWMDINDGFILDDELRSHDDDRVVRTLKFIGIHVFDLPSDVVAAMKDSASDSVKTVLEKQTLNFVSFFERLFPKLQEIPADLRNPIVHNGLRYLLDETKQGYQELNSLYKKTKCIPCSPDGEELARPCDLINPNDPSISRLYSPEEGRFPHGNLDGTQMFVLAEKLGMVKDLLSWEEIRGRAMSIEKLAETNKEAALLRSRYLVCYLRCNIEKLKKMNDVYIYRSTFQEMKFLPVRLTPTESYTLPWKGTEFRSSSTQFSSPNKLFWPEDDTLIGSACFIVDDTEKSGCGSLKTLKDVLGFSCCPSNHDVFKQLEITRESDATNEMKFKVCKRVYKHLNDQLDKDSDVTRKLRSSPWLYLEGTFVENKKIAMKWKGNAVPFLYSVPGEYTREYKNLLKLADIKKQFTANDFLEALDLFREAKKDKESKKDMRLSEKDIRLVVSLINELEDCEVNERVGTIPMPDKKGDLYDSGDLTIPESFEAIYSNTSELFIHEKITPVIARKLGAKLLRDRRRKRYSSKYNVMPFGQFEKLTDRIKNILESYPCDAGILKELVQNADDAKATEIQFIYDKRKLPHERVLQNQASEIQGPALCVYNNKQFSEDDFTGICKLGIGSKQDDPAKTGQYGIGFNAVYHLTDCPSFLSNDSTLCILDPHCEYAPEATLDAPGGRYNNIDDDFRDIFSDTLSGFLEDFPLKESTMFRLPLRTSEQATKSGISKRAITNEIMTNLLEEFQTEAKKLLLFLNHVKEIGLWKIDENSELKPLYSVSSKLKPKNEKKLHELHGYLQDHKKLETHEILIKDTTYSIHIQDTERLQEKWLIHQSFGIREEAMNDEQTPNGCDLGLFPRGGIAALLSTTNCLDLEKYVAYCFLPLPVTTSLPVHINGHFALNASRRELWSDPGKRSRKSKWNAFMKEQVLGPAYASLIAETKKRIPHCKNLEKTFFSSKEDATEALNWYHRFLPDPDKDPKWDTLAVAVYQFLKESAIFPVVSEKDQIVECRSSKSSGSRSQGRHKRETPASSVVNYRNLSSTKHDILRPVYRETARKNISEHMTRQRHAAVAQRRCETRFYIEWLPPNHVYFTEEEIREDEEALLAALLEIRMPVLLYTPMRIYEALKKSEVTTNLLSPKNVIDFLLKSQDESSRCVIGKLPIQLRQSNIQNESNLQSIFEYCETKLEESPSNLEGLPLLLTADNMLRVFTANSPVYCTEFCKLFPDKASRFVHLQFVPLLLSLSEAELGIIRHLTITSLAEEFMPDVFREKLPLGETKHVPWSYPENGVLSKKWFMDLWRFLQSRGKNSNHLVRFLGEYPIIPTTDGNLATIANAKSVLAIIESKKESHLKQKVTKILKSLSCPFLDMSITKHASTVVEVLVANPHRESDVLHVLDYMNSNDLLDLSKFNDEKINTLFRFFQADCENRESMDKAKKLPFYKGIDDCYHSLSSFSFRIKVPDYLPENGVKELQGIYRQIILFLPSSISSDFHRLFEALGITLNCDISEFYINYVLPNFTSLSPECQVDFLLLIRSMLHPYYNNSVLIEMLKLTKCIPDQTGNLHHASRHLNPHNKLFQAFKTDADVFPAPPFNDEQWLDFLNKIGMKKNCDEERFIKFAKSVEQSARRMTETIETQSKALVEYLLGSERDGNWSFDKISEIKFIVPEEIEKELSSIHPQHHVNGNLEFISYSDSVPWKYRHLVWTSAKLLPDWAYPHRIYLTSSLRVTSRPQIDAVSEHLKVISKCTSDIIVSGRSLPDKLVEVFEKIYEFLVSLMNNCEKEISSKCSKECHKIGKCLTSVACILLNDERCLVGGEKLSIEDTKDKLKPHFYKIPRDYAQFDHLLKRLGATEKISASQMANVLKSIKDSSTDEKMNSEEEEKACFATSVLFQSLLDDKESEADSSLENCEELILPSLTKRLVTSNKLVCQMQPRLHESLEKQGIEILYPLEKCGLKRQLESDYLGAVPKRLRPTPLSEMVREELHPSCKNTMSCIYCQTMDCPFIQKFILLLRSSQFEYGITRLLKHQKKVTKLDDKDRERAARFTSTKLTTIRCMKQVQIRLVNVLEEKPLPGSSVDRSCHVEREENSWTLYIQHEFGGKKNHAIFAKAVNEIMDRCLEQTAELSDMLSCDSPSQIPGVLNDHDVAIDYNEEIELLGQSVPNVCHHLIIQKPLCDFKQGDRVAYDAKEGGVGDWKESGDLTEKSINYIFVKINSRKNAVDKNDAEFDFNAEYIIDLGSKANHKEVSVLDLYSYNHDDMGNLVLCDEDGGDNMLNLSAEKDNITRALNRTKQLSLSQRRKVLRRFFLHWFRSTHAGELTAFLESEVTRLGILTADETRHFTRRWKRYGRWEKDVFDSYNHWKEIEDSSSYSDVRCSSGHRRLYNVHEAAEYVTPDLEEAKRWIEQAKADLDVAKVLLEAKYAEPETDDGVERSCCSQVCYMSQQCVEKVLKGVLYAKCGIPRRELRTHDISRLASSVGRLTEAPGDALSRAHVVANYYLATRYPDNQPKYKVPAKEYSEEKANEALEVATTTFEALRQFAIVSDN